MKVGVELNIDVTKIEKERLFQGKKGKYLTMTVFVDPANVDQYGNNGMITHKKKEGEERAPILGNCKVFWTENGSHNNQPAPPPQQSAPKPAQQGQGFDDFDDDIPFN